MNLFIVNMVTIAVGILGTTTINLVLRDAWDATSKGKKQNSVLILLSIVLALLIGMFTAIAIQLNVDGL